MLSGSRGDSTSVTKYPYVSPLPEAPSRLECYWYVDVSSRTETIGAPFESIMSAANTSHPFSIPYSVLRSDCLCLCMSSWLPKARIREDTRLFVFSIPGDDIDSGEVSKYMGHAWVPASLVSQRVSPLFSLSPCLLICLFSRSQLRIPTSYEQLVYPGAEGISYAWFRFSKLCLFAAVRSHRRTSFLLLLLFGNPWVPSSPVYVLPDSFPSFYRSLLAQDLV